MTEEREMTALDAPVGAGAEQSLNNYNGIIPDYGEDFNPSAEEMFEAQMQYEQEMQAQAQVEREAAPGFMQTVSMPMTTGMRFLWSLCRKTHSRR